MKRTALDISTASTASARLQSKFILRDTMGPTQVARSALNGSECSSSTSSIKELSAADEKGLNRSFRAIQMAKYGSNPRPMNPAGPRTEPVRRIEDQTNNEGRGTPSSTASSHSGQRVIFGKDGKNKTFTPSALQLKQTTRDIIKDQRRRPSVEVNHVGNPATPNNVEETSMKTPYHQMEIFTDESPNLDMRTHDSNEEESKGTGRCLLKCTILGLCVAILVAAMALLIHFYKDDEPPGPRPVVSPEPECQFHVHTVKFREAIIFNCKLRSESLTKLEATSYVEIQTPTFYNSYKVISTKETDGWAYDLNKQNGKIKISGPNATCSSSGTYMAIFKDNSSSTLHTVELKLDVLSEVSKVSVNMTQQDTAEKQWRISCSTNSGCQQAFVDFYAVINKTREETYIRGVHFSCNITYDDVNGYSVSCVGIIPELLVQQFRLITCRPSSVLLGDDDDVKALEEHVQLPDCDISNNCGYKCNSNFSRDYYTVAQERCDIFHRCYENNVYSTFCPPETFFNPATCTCDHSKKIDWCRSDGLNYGIEGKKETWCDESKTTKGTTTNETLSQTTKGGTEQTTSATTKQTNKAITENRTDADTEKTTNATTKNTTDADTKQTTDADTKQTTDADTTQTTDEKSD